MKSYSYRGFCIRQKKNGSYYTQLSKSRLIESEYIREIKLCIDNVLDFNMPPSHTRENKKLETTFWGKQISKK